MPRTRTRVAISVIEWVMFFAAVAALWPSQLGGCTGFVIINGPSMEPTLMPGDLAITQCISEPQVGRVVIYTPISDEKGLVIHRIVGGDESGWKLQGDNNSWVDPFSPTNDDVKGTLLLRIPYVGNVLGFLASPAIYLSLLALAAALVLWPARAKPDPAKDQDKASAVLETSIGLGSSAVLGSGAALGSSAVLETSIGLGSTGELDPSRVLDPLSTLDPESGRKPEPELVPELQPTRELVRAVEGSTPPARGNQLDTSGNPPAHRAGIL